LYPAGSDKLDALDHILWRAAGLLSPKGFTGGKEDEAHNDEDFE
jgi:hypothetical protein